MPALPSRTLGRTGRTVSSIGLGTWQLGADWGEVTEADARAVLDASLDAGVTFYDTADVYGDGRSESLIGAWRRDRADDRIVVATKIGRRVDLDPELYTMENFRSWIDRSRREPRHGHARPRAAALPADRRLLDRPGLRRPRRARRRGRARRLRRERRDLGRGADVDRAPACRERADRAQRVPAEAARRGAARRAGCRGRHHRAGPAGERPAERPVHPRHGVRGRRPPQLQPRRGRRSTAARRSPASTTTRASRARRSSRRSPPRPGSSRRRPPSPGSRSCRA